MKAQLITNYGGIDVFELQDIPKPSPKANEVLVKIYASSVNTADIKGRELGQALDFTPTPPAVIGMDFAGIVEEVGDDVSNFAVGDEVYGCAGGVLELQGTMAEYIAADYRLIAKKPTNLNMIEAAALPLVSITAIEGFKRSGIKKGDKVLIHGGVGGVGHIALQYAKQAGAEVYATGRAYHKEIIEQLGATAIDFEKESIEEYTNKHTNGKGFDIVYDSVGGDNMLNSFQAARRNGQIISTVSIVELDLTIMHIKGLSLHVVYMLMPMMYDENREMHGEILNELKGLCESGSIRPLLDNSHFTLETAPQAQEHLDKDKTIGKVVIEIAR
ncbi:MAG: zinc-dependent alcohol dehydrogenase family protein [Hyphomicrobiales bacterium]